MKEIIQLGCFVTIFLAVLCEPPITIDLNQHGNTKKLKKAAKKNKDDRMITKDIYMNTWAVRVVGDDAMAKKVAAENGFIYKGKVFGDVYEFIHRGVPRRRKRASFIKTLRLGNDNRVRWTQQQASKVRTKRSIAFNDEKWEDQWYIHRTEPGFEGHDMNILDVWKRGITGKGVVVSVLDDGIEYTHPELKDNYDPRASFDYNSNDADPLPKYTWRDENKYYDLPRHGTRCAGEIAATPNNTNCIVGVAYGARIGGIRMLDGEVTDMIEAQSLRHNRDYIDIYSSSWGPEDDGKTVDGPGPLTTRTLADGAKYGRKGKGNIFVWASGNGGNKFDYCNCDGYTNSIYTISVSAATSIGTQPWYLESCASTLVSTYSGGKNRLDKHIVTADLNGKCTDKHTGTSVAPPMVAGVVALALEINPNLTWRDIQHLLVETSSLELLKGDDFKFNGAGKRFSHSYGFGMVNANKMVNLAAKWLSVGEQHQCGNEKEIQRFPFNTFNKTKPLVIKIKTKGCRGTGQSIKYIEHVQICTSVFHSWQRGATEISIQSPMGTVSWVLKRRALDNKAGDFNEWKFLSTHFWGEDPRGTWKITFHSTDGHYRQGYLTNLRLIIYGTEQKPGEIGGADGGLSHRCHDECVFTCSGPKRHQCHHCKSLYYMDGNDVQHCVNSCPTQMYLKKNSKECLPCHKSCLKCSDSNETDCIMCHPNAVMQNGKCTKECPIGSFKTEDDHNKNSFHCQLCYKRCSSCSGSSRNCSACHKGSTLKENRCVATCAVDQWVDDQHHCQVCHESCKTCTGGSEYNCTSCTKKALNDKVDRFLYKTSQCLAVCPIGTYLGETLMMDCLDCPDNCLKCSSDGRKCEICDGSHFLIASVGKCVKECGEGYYMDVIKKTCEPCYSQCKSCVPGKPSVCTSCRENFYLKDQSCVSKQECRTRYYVNYDTGRCNFCPVPCTFCESAKFCTGCFLSYYLTPEHKCVQKCPKGTYTTADQKCKYCSPSCSECDGPSRFECTACSNDKYLLKGECKETIPSGFFAVSYGKTRFCRRCHHLCGECNGPYKHNCTTCVETLDMRKDGCTNPCLGQWLSENSCSSCHPSCLSCHGPTKRHCLSCRPGYLLNIDTYECTTVCPRMYYKDEATQTCKRCHQSCSTCNGPNPDQCSSCPWKLLFFNNTCSPECPSGWYSHIVSPTCLKCSPACKSCKYQPNLCIDCRPGQVWDDYRCFDKCGEGKHRDVENNRCYYCDESCKTCNGTAPNECLSCPSGTTLSNGVCLPGCLLGYYNASSSGKCTPCMKNCLLCEETTGNRVRCKVCSNSTVLQPDGTCSKSCPLGTYRVPYENVCKPCPFKECLQCPLGQKCTHCKPLFSVSGGICKSACGEGTYQNFKKQECSKCHRLCLECKGPTKHDCFQCRKTALTLLKRDKRISCVQECPLGYFKEDNFCLPCDAECTSCETSEKCLSCNNPYIFQDFKCVPECGMEYHHNKLNNICDPCSSYGNCTRCSGTLCLKCHPGASFLNGKCVNNCGKGFYSSEQKCLSCSKKFVNCHVCSKSVCTECIDGFDFSNDICIEKITTTTTTTTSTTSTTTTSTTTTKPPSTTTATPTSSTTTPTSPTTTPTSPTTTSTSTTTKPTTKTIPTTKTTTPDTTSATTEAATKKTVTSNSTSKTTTSSDPTTTTSQPKVSKTTKLKSSNTTKVDFNTAPKTLRNITKITTPSRETVKTTAETNKTIVKPNLEKSGGNYLVKLEGTDGETTQKADVRIAISELDKNSTEVRDKKNKNSILDTNQAIGISDQKQKTHTVSKKNPTKTSVHPMNQNVKQEGKSAPKVEESQSDVSEDASSGDDDEGSTFLSSKKGLFNVLIPEDDEDSELEETLGKAENRSSYSTGESPKNDTSYLTKNVTARNDSIIFEPDGKRTIKSDESIDTPVVTKLITKKTAEMNLKLSGRRNVTTFNKSAVKLITIDPDNMPQKRSRRSVENIDAIADEQSTSFSLTNIFLVVVGLCFSLCVLVWRNSNRIQPAGTI